MDQKPTIGITRPYRSYSDYFRERYGQKAYRVAVDAGFSCPNRGGRDRPGCTYCEVSGARAPYLDQIEGLSDQVERGLAFLRRRYHASLFVLYFQAYTGTFAPLHKLRRLYDHGLSLHPFRELVVSTRPDCVNSAVARLLASYRSETRDVWVELGLQSAHNRTLDRVRRGHSVEDFDRAFELLKTHGIKVAVHLMFGLPGEGWSEIRKTIDYLARLKPDGVKIHNLHIPYGAPLYAQYLAGGMPVIGPERHLRYTVGAIERLPEHTVIMRLTCDSYRTDRAAPRRFWDKQRFAREVAREMRARSTWQGRLLGRR